MFCDIDGVGKWVLKLFKGKFLLVSVLVSTMLRFSLTKYEKKIER